MTTETAEFLSERLQAILQAARAALARAHALRSLFAGTEGVSADDRQP